MKRTVLIERFSLIDSKPLDEVIEAINVAVGYPDMAEFWQSAHRTHSVDELENTIQKALGKSGLMFFIEFDHGAILRKETGLDTLKMMRFLIGNPLIVKEMAKHDLRRWFLRSGPNSDGDGWRVFIERPDNQRIRKQPVKPDQLRLHYFSNGYALRWLQTRAGASDRPRYSGPGKDTTVG